MLRQAERSWNQLPSLKNWIRLLHISEAAGQPRFSQEALETSLGPGEVGSFERTPTGFIAQVQNAVYPYRRHIIDRSTADYDDLEAILDTTNWNGQIAVAWRDDDEDPELRIAVAESWNHGPTYQGNQLITLDYRYYGNAVTNDEELDAALFDAAHWEGPI